MNVNVARDRQAPPGGYGIQSQGTEDLAMYSQSNYRVGVPPPGASAPPVSIHTYSFL